MVIAYLRVSTTRQHLENQRGEILHYTNNKGITVDRWITDTISGKTESRKRNLGKTLKHLKSGDTLIVTEISRLSRSLHEIMTIMKYCVDNNISIYSTKDGYTFDDSINSKVLSFAFGLAAEIEHKLISQRTKEAMALRKAQGEHMGRRKGSGVKIGILYENKGLLMKKLSTEKTIKAICEEFNISCSTLYRFAAVHHDIFELINQRNRRADTKIK
jgi:DNA invertase Pin-like site-specific DNA recombinase